MRTEGIGNKIFLIVLLCAALGLFLYLRPRLFSSEPRATLMERLPESDILGRFYVLDVARETSAMMYYQKVPFRDLASSEFILSQAKNFGLDIQKPGYFFADGTGEWGTFVYVADSARIPKGFISLSQFTEVRDTTVLECKLKYLPEPNLYFYYDKDYLFLYHGSKLKTRLSRAIYARHGETGRSWKKFNKIKTFRNEKLVVFSNSEKLHKYGVEYGLFAHDSDSLSFKLKTYIKASHKLKIKMKAPSIALAEMKDAERMLNLHLDITEFRKDKNSPLYKWIVEMGRKVSFPTDAFFEAWDGDLSFHQGGTQLVEEEVVETGYDDEFNITEIRTVKMVPVPGFAVLISVNEKGKALVSNLFGKGIITKQGNKYRFLFSPPLKMNILPGSLSAYSSNRSPALAQSALCGGVWMYRGTKVTFQVDSLTKKEVFGSIRFPVNHLLRKNKFFL